MPFWIGSKKIRVKLFSSQLCYFSLFPPVTLFSPPLLHYFFFFPPDKLLNSVAANLAQDIYYKKQPPSYAISTYARFFEDTMIA